MSRDRGYTKLRMTYATSHVRHAAFLRKTGQVKMSKRYFNLALSFGNDALRGYHVQEEE